MNDSQNKLPTLHAICSQIMKQSLLGDPPPEALAMAEHMFFMGTSALQGLLAACGRMPPEEGLPIFQRIQAEANTRATMHFVPEAELAELMAEAEARGQATSVLAPVDLAKHIREQEQPAIIDVPTGTPSIY